MLPPDQLLRLLFQTAVDAADPMRCVPEHLPPKPECKVLVVGAGKASARMAEAVEQEWGPCTGLIITRDGYERPLQGLSLASASHPVPDERGIAATQRLRAMLGGLGPDDFALAMISGGGSALLEDPAPPMTLDDLKAVNEALLASGAPISAMNVVRKHLSRVKGGQLAALAHPAKMLTLLISDVPGDDPADIASGPTVGETSTRDDALAILERFAITLPANALEALRGESLVMAPDAPELSTSETVIVAAPSKSIEAAADVARQQGITVSMLGDDLEGEARDLAREHAALALKTANEMGPGDAPHLILSGGECTVTRTGNGVGGPNAEYALSFAIEAAGNPQIHCLACDTDGVDGAAEVAGAIVGPTTLDMAHSVGWTAETALADNDTHTFFQRVGSQVVTGPTLTNVNDFRAILVQPPSF